MDGASVGALSPTAAAGRFLPTTPLARIRFVSTALVLAANAFFFMWTCISSILGADYARSPWWPYSIVGVAGLTAGVCRITRQGRLERRSLFVVLLSVAATAATDGELQLSTGMAQSCVVVLCLYANKRQCIAVCIAAQAVLSTAAYVKEQFGGSSSVNVGESFSHLVGIAMLAALAYTVSAALSRYEEGVSRDAVVARAGIDIVAARTRKEIYESVLDAAVVLTRSDCYAAIVKLEPGSEPSLVLSARSSPSVGTVRLSGDDTPPSVRQQMALAVARSVASIDAPAHEAPSALIVSLGEDAHRVVALCVVQKQRLPKGTVAGIRSLGLYARLAVRNAELTEVLERQAFRDSLTGFANRAALQSELTRAVAGDLLGRAAVAVMMIDLDGFKNVNDTLGHAAGDELLVRCADRIKNSVRENDFVARLGGDEFVVLLSEVDGPSVVTGVADRIIAMLAEPFTPVVAALESEQVSAWLSPTRPVSPALSCCPEPIPPCISPRPQGRTASPSMGCIPRYRRLSPAAYPAAGVFGSMELCTRAARCQSGAGGRSMRVYPSCR